VADNLSQNRPGVSQSYHQALNRREE